MPSQSARLHRFGDIAIDCDRLEVQRDGKIVDLEPKAFRVLLYLIENRHRVVSKEELISAIWAGAFVTDNVLTRVVAQIRKQLGDSARAPRYIETAATTGYRFVAELLPEEWPKSAKAPQLGSIRHLTTSLGSDLWPSFSPDGSQIAFSSNRTGRFEIYTRSLVPGSTERQITSDGRENIQPAWSPDGQYLAYVSGKTGGICVMPATGGPVRHLTDRGDSPRWSPDGQTLVFREHTRNVNHGIENVEFIPTTLATISLDSGSVKHLTDPGKPPGGHASPTWLPDGRHVLFSAWIHRPAYALSSAPWIIDTLTGELVPIDVGPATAQFPTLSPDGRYLYFGRAAGHDSGLWRATLGPAFQAQPPELLIPTGGSWLRDLTMSARGGHLAYSFQSAESALLTVSLDARGNPESEPEPLIRDRAFSNYDPVFSADGSKIAYTSMRQGFDAGMIYMANRDGSSATAITPPDQNAGDPNWIGNGLTIGYAVRGGKDQGYWVKSPDEPPARGGWNLDWELADRINISKDGLYAAAHVWTSTSMRIVVGGLGAGAARVITPADKSVGFPKWSPDGRWIAAMEDMDGNSTLVILPFEGGPIQTLVSEPAQSFAVDWSPDGDKILFNGLRDGVWNMYWVSRSTREIRRLTNFADQAGFVRWGDWSPDGWQVIFERSDLTSNIYVADLH